MPRGQTGDQHRRYGSAAIEPDARVMVTVYPPIGARIARDFPVNARQDPLIGKHRLACGPCCTRHPRERLRGREPLKPKWPGIMGT